MKETHKTMMELIEKINEASKSDDLESVGRYIDELESLVRTERWKNTFLITDKISRELNGVKENNHKKRKIIRKLLVDSGIFTEKEIKKFFSSEAEIIIEEAIKKMSDEHEKTTIKGVYWLLRKLKELRMERWTNDNFKKS